MFSRIQKSVVALALILSLSFSSALSAYAAHHEDDALMKAISQLSKEQKAALLVLVQGIVEGKGESPTEGAMKTIKAYVKAAEEGSTDGLLACFSEDFDHYEVGDKASLRAYIEGVEAEGYLEDITGNTEDAEAEVDGDTVTIYPVELEGIFGTVTYEFELKKEGSDWKIVSFVMTGV